MSFAFCVSIRTAQLIMLLSESAQPVQPSDGIPAGRREKAFFQKRRSFETKVPYTMDRIGSGLITNDFNLRGRNVQPRAALGVKSMADLSSGPARSDKCTTASIIADLCRAQASACRS
jgi:hypothetical protein